MSGGNIKVVVRCRPLNSRELGRGAKGLIRMEGEQTILEPPEVSGQVSSRATEKKVMTFSFDKSYWSAGPRDDPKYASQQTLYEDLGVELLDHSFQGFNTCIFAYGQTGSGKSYSMMGYGADKGIIPLTTSELFRRVEDRTAKENGLSYTVEVSYIEIYNEKVRDLLNPKNKDNLRVREHPSLGPYVEDLSRLVVENYAQMMTLMDEGNKARTVASTNMNETSSRSHAVFTVILTQKRHDSETNMTGEKVSKISLVDLAGSERQSSTGATGTRLKEGANINRSLTTLGKVIAALASASDTTRGKKKKDDFVPYRDSVLTWLLKESLGGNSKTAMIAAISPADYEETLSTLRYADAAKRIKTHAVVNEAPNAKLIRELKEELDMLRSRVAAGASTDESAYDPSVPAEKQIVTYKTKNGEIRRVTKLELQDQLQASEKLMESLNLTWEEKMAKTQAIQIEREKALEELGILVDKDMVGVHAPQHHPSLVNLNEDPLMSECLVYQLKPGTTTAGSEDSKAHIKLSGDHISPEHCIFSNEEGVVTIEAMPDARTFVNGKRVPPKEQIKLLNGFRVILGDFHVFRFNDPAAVRAHRQKLRGSVSVADLKDGAGGGSPEFRPDSPRVEEMMDWSAARREVADIAKLGDQDLDKLFDDIVKVRTQRKRPESRFDLSAELESRLMTASQTDETENPWALAHGTTMTTNTSNSHGTPKNEDKQPQSIDYPSDTESSSTLAKALAFDHHQQSAADSALEKQHLTKQLKTLAQELKRTRAQAAAARALDSAMIEPANWTARQLRLVKKAVDKWRALRTYKMAEEILTGAVDLKEANVIAMTLGWKVSYNFLVVHGSTSNPSSSLDDLNGIVEFEDVASGGVSINGPAVVVKVLDREAGAVYIWGLQKFALQLNKMRHALTLNDKPNHSHHFRIEGTFTDVPPPSYSFVGAARAPLRMLAHQLSYGVIVPIQCPYTMEAIGSCRVGFKTSLQDNGDTGARGIELPLGNHIALGDKFTFVAVVDTVKGLSSGDFASVHVQTRLSSLVGPAVTSEDTFASTLVNLEETSVAHLSLRRTVSVVVTREMITHFRDGYAIIEVFAKVRPEYLDRLERFDRSREISSGTLPSAPGTPVRPGDPLRPSMRRCETDFVAPEHHDVLASVAIKELSFDGTYVPCEVEDDVVLLHQGVQRQINVIFSHSSGKALPWTNIEHLSSSDIRVVDAGNAVTVSKPEVQVRNVSQQVEYAMDGTATIRVSGTWDTAAHHCSHLDRRTKGTCRILVRLTVLVEVETLDEPAVFQIDVPIRILGRDARRSSLLTFFSAPKVFHSFTCLFSVDLNPPLVTCAGDLWRLDTCRKHVKGQEKLGDWKARGVSLIEDFRRMRKTDTALVDVQATKVILDLLGQGDLDVDTDTGRKDEVVKRCVELWREAMETTRVVDLKRRSGEEEASLKKLREMVPDLAPKLVPTVKPIHRIDNVAKQGPMMVLVEASSNTWEKRHFVIRRPFLQVHHSPNEREVKVINLSGATVTLFPDAETLLEKEYTFTLFTLTNSYVFYVNSSKELAEWMSVIETTARG